MKQRRSGTTMIAAGLILGLSACAIPSDRFPAEPYPPQDPEFEEFVAELNRDAERQMEEMMRENEEFLNQFESDSDSLPMTGLGR